ncbi:hypothetical protein GCM10011531_12060 [Aquaticitalea lipolytica]|uniref:Uncharacterized protein n=1 Tax=Aquaticitalea lipolytica TaxID=1247562 RepID=A0A8J2TQZ4_9FLAO|nr:hypothetical protein [Aquaticitalea lipolytica]GFZ83010.1 hypothetical protein GCM10011531_12060 [Aquaticitalea lipolytica]
MVNKKHKILGEYLSLIVMTCITIMAIYSKQITVFYIIYLFWCDEFLKTIFDGFRYRFKKEQIQNPTNYILNIKNRFFMLLIYLVFIIVCFGLILDWNNTDLILGNFEVFFFKNTLFNISLITFLLREIYLYKNNQLILNSHHLLSSGIITLHISLILGIMLSFLIKKEFVVFENYAAVFAIIPFLLLKLYFEIQEIKYNSKEA